MEGFFKNENEAAPSSISCHWFLKFCNNSYLATPCLDSLVPFEKDPLDVNANILMAWLMVIVHMLSTKECKPFE